MTRMFRWLAHCALLCGVATALVLGGAQVVSGSSLTHECEGALGTCPPLDEASCDQLCRDSGGVVGHCFNDGCCVCAS